MQKNIHKHNKVLKNTTVGNIVKYTAIMVLALLLIVNLTVSILAEDNYPEVKTPNKTLMQAFYWEMNKGSYAEEYPEEANLWQLLSDRAYSLKDLGITALWLPPANKADGGQLDEGYAAYDLWDLGEFDQKGSIRTKYGTRPGLEFALSILHSCGIDVYYDAVLNHRMGGDKVEEVTLNGDKEFASTIFDLKGREAYYSKEDEWDWNWRAFDGVNSKLFEGKSWDNTADKDYLLGYDVDYQNDEVIEEMNDWGRWIVDDIGFDGFRLDAVKHIDSDFINEWVNYLEANSEKELMIIGEAWYENVMGLMLYLKSMDNENLHVFDFPLRNKFAAMRDGRLNMSALAGAGMVNKDGYGDRVVTFVDNHDTGRDNTEYTPPIFKRKMQAYTYILTRAEGIPMVFWKDYYNSGMKDEMSRVIKARKYFAYGEGREVDNSDLDIYAYVREGIKDTPGTGLVMMIAGGESGEVVEKEIDSGQINQKFYDFTGNVQGFVRTDEDGYGRFKVVNSEEKGWSIWVPAMPE